MRSVKKGILASMLAMVAGGFLMASGAGAAITPSGDTTVNASTYVGYSSWGSLTINEGSTLASSYGAVGYATGSTGIVTVDGVGSAWNNGNYYLYVGLNGAGNLKITNGGTVSSRYCYTGSKAGSTGTMTVDGLGSTLSLTGSTTGGSLVVGEKGAGTLAVTNGATVQAPGYYGFHIGSSSAGDGTVIIDGAGSSASAAYIRLGNSGTGRLSILNGANLTITSANGYTSSIGNSATGSGIAVVDGPGSAWTNAASVAVGGSGTAKLSVSNGGLFTAASLSIGSSSNLTTDVGYGSTLSVGTGAITNNGTIRLVAGAGAGNGTYTPMYYGTLTGNTPQALGGVWNDTDHTVTVNPAAVAPVGTMQTIDLAVTQRLAFTDAAGKIVAGVSFQAATASTPLEFIIRIPTCERPNELQNLLSSGQSVLSAWHFLPMSGYTAGDPVYVSVLAGAGQSLSTLGIWHYDGSTWSAITANDLAYDGTYASFTLTSLDNIYAVSGSAPVPIPAAVWLLGSGLAGLVGMRRRLHRKAKGVDERRR
jgi:T5SS/PEP-CTERM-associated repeat protein